MEARTNSLVVSTGYFLQFSLNFVRTVFDGFVPSTFAIVRASEGEYSMTKELVVVPAKGLEQVGCGHISRFSHSACTCGVF